MKIKDLVESKVPTVKRLAHYLIKGVRVPKLTLPDNFVEVMNEILEEYFISIGGSRTT